MNINEALNLLNLSGTVSKEEIKKAYKKMAMKYHPDRNTAGVEVMKALNAAFEFLSSLDMEEVTHTNEEEAYNYAEDLADVIEVLQTLENVEIEVCGNWIWLSGNTKPYKETLKELGCYWASKKLKWYYRPEEHKSCRHKAWDMEKIRSKYGSETHKATNYNRFMIAA